MALKDLHRWVDKMATLTMPDSLHWYQGNQKEIDDLTQLAHYAKQGLLKGTLTNPDNISKLLLDKPGDWYSVIEQNSIKPDLPVMQMLEQEQTTLQQSIYHIFEGSMKGRIMYVVPFSMSPRGGPVQYIAVELTDSPLAVVLRAQNNLAGNPVLYSFRDHKLVRSLHTRGKMYKASEISQLNQPVDFQKKFIITCPGKRIIWSYGTYYGSIRPKQTTRYGWWV